MGLTARAAALSRSCSNGSARRAGQSGGQQLSGPGLRGSGAEVAKRAASTCSTSLGAFTDAIGLPTAFARRQARNTQLILMEEANLGRVADPAGGAWSLESLSDQIARAAWTEFQAIEAAGGVIAALGSGLVQAKVAEAREARLAAIAAKEEKVLGVTVFRNGDDQAVPIEDPVAIPAEAPDPRLPGPDGACEPLAPVRFAAAFEEA